MYLDTDYLEQYGALIESCLNRKVFIQAPINIPVFTFAPALTTAGPITVPVAVPHIPALPPKAAPAKQTESDFEGVSSRVIFPELEDGHDSGESDFEGVISQVIFPKAKSTTD